MAEAMRVGVIGCGAISGNYIDAARRLPEIEIVAVADLRQDVAEAKAREFQIAAAPTMDQLLADPSIELVLNLTIPKAHVEVSRSILEAGKHLYSEKPLAVTREQGRQLLELAAAKNLRVGCAPDTFMGTGVQTARHAIDTGAIGRPVAFTAFMMYRGPEAWHANPQFYFEAGAGPMFDMGPYYLTALLNFFGPIRRITGAASIAVPDRTITSKPHFGEKIRVETPDHVCGTMEFENGVIGTIIQSFATWHPTYDRKFPLTVFGTDATLKVPDPNLFDGPVEIRQGQDADWQEIPSRFAAGYGRSVGAADMARAIRENRPHRASGELGYAILDAMAGFLDSAASGCAHEPAFKFERPAPMPMIE
jgi:predicted dehydrogenase